MRDGAGFVFDGRAQNTDAGVGGVVHERGCGPEITRQDQRIRIEKKDESRSAARRADVAGGAKAQIARVVKNVRRALFPYQGFEA